mgnify:CR=1 FL=1
MANYEATARSNYFTVKNLPAFTAWCSTLGIEVSPSSDQNAGHVAMFFLDGIPSSSYNEDTQDLEDLDFYGDLASHLIAGQVAVIMEIGHEKMRYLVGHAVAVNAAGERREITLNAIYALAQELAPDGMDISCAEY